MYVEFVNFHVLFELKVRLTMGEGSCSPSTCCLQNILPQIGMALNCVTQKNEKSKQHWSENIASSKAARRKNISNR